MRRREFIAGLGSAVAWPVIAQAQQGDRVRRIGVLMPADENDPAYKPRVSAFIQALWIWVGPIAANVRMEVRCAAANVSDTVGSGFAHIIVCF
jgi:putative ABC transport system substrate-binding protein